MKREILSELGPISVWVVMVMALGVMVLSASAMPEENPDGPDDWVDLGLPSGLLWATRNVGATTPEEYGDYFAWAETTPKGTYDWTNLRYSVGGCNQLTKYCGKSSYGSIGFTDSLSVLQPPDDAATALYGGRIPTKEDWQELIDNTTSQWTTQNHVYGRRFTGANGNSIFLPAAGGRNGKSLEYGTNCGFYWSSSLYTEYPCSAWYCYFFTDGCYVGYYGRAYGHAVRAVR